ncbi:hypothetical protein RZS08_66660, partial [Arthrospira platensis SPKY1]|nr:hypothetical protein [Arthrospira platensis SPKY1]
ALFIVLTSIFLFRANTKASGSYKVGMAAALAYPLMASIYTFYGVSPNAELFFNALTAAAIALSIPPLLISSPPSLSLEKNPAPPHKQNPFSAHILKYALAGFL